MLSRMIASKSRCTVRANILAQDITAQRQRQTGLALPPFAEIEDFLKPAAA